ncbi:chloramphenicol phosphotransferase CPT family protein [Microlunatus sp. GCM10028923]|uniref:chloramphenicol phosphotransferase CPT family protein n=1 Tax=Microlunatus sp. GCM10028923 TaxID=3273400 RepID=UPI00362048F3
MIINAVVLNGGSSSGKSSLARALQDQLPDPWLTFGVDDFIEALPRRLTGDGDGISIGTDGAVDVGAAFMEQETLWMQGIGAMARAGAKIIIDDVFLGGDHSQGRWRSALTGAGVLWVGVRCAPDVAEARERARGDRTVGMARRQADLVHRNVTYDLEVDTGTDTAADAAARITPHLA